MRPLIDFHSALCARVFSPLVSPRVRQVTPRGHGSPVRAAPTQGWGSGAYVWRWGAHSEQPYPGPLPTQAGAAMTPQCGP